jgi:hypothetical protein
MGGSRRTPAKRKSQDDADYADDDVRDFTSKSRLALPLGFRLELRTKLPGGQIRFNNVWYASTRQGIYPDKGDSSTITYSKLDGMVQRFCEKYTLNETTGKKFVPCDINNSGCYLYVRKERIKDFEVPAGDRSGHAKPISSTEQLHEAINSVAFRQEEHSRRVTKITGLILDVLVVGKSLKPKQPKQKSSRPKTVGGPRNDDESDVSDMPSTATATKKKIPEDKEIDISFQILPPTYLAAKPKDPEVLEYVIRTHDLAKKEAVYMKSTGISRISAIDVVERIQQEAFELDAYKIDKNGESVTLIPIEATLYYRKMKSSKQMTPIESTEELWQLIHLKKSGKYAPEIKIGSLYFSLGARKIDSDDPKHAAITPEYLDPDDDDYKFCNRQYTQDFEQNPNKYRSPMKLPTTKVISANEQRRFTTWDVVSGKEESSDFVKKLYTSPSSPLYHGFHKDHAKLMMSWFSAHQKYGEDKDQFIWEVFELKDDNVDSWPTIDQLKIDFEHPDLESKCHGSFPEKEAFQPTIDEPEEPPKPRPKTFMSPAQVMASSINSLSAAIVQSKAAAAATTPVSSFAVAKERHRLVAFKFVREEEYESYEMDYVAKTNEKMGDVIKSAWERDVEFTKGVFSLIPSSTIDQMNAKDIDMMFLIPNLGSVHCNMLCQYTVQEVADAVGEEPRPIPIAISFEAAKKTSAKTAVPLNLFSS